MKKCQEGTDAKKELIESSGNARFFHQLFSISTCSFIRLQTLFNFGQVHICYRVLLICNYYFISICSLFKRDRSALAEIQQNGIAFV